MASVSISSDSMDKVEELQGTFDIKPSKKKVTERAIELYHEQRVKQTTEEH